MNPKFAAAARAAKTLLDELLPPFAGLGACSEMAPNRAPAAEMFADDVAEKRDMSYDWADRIQAGMAICARCPVRLHCLAWAFEIEKRESQDWWTGEWEPLDRRYGIYGGVPGRIREHYADAPDPVAACDSWFMEQMQMRHLVTWDSMAIREEAI